jgi:hypothetical protein
MASSIEPRPRVLVAYFSYTGNTRIVAEALSENLQRSSDVNTVEIVPERNRSYLHWLMYSFVPRSEVEIKNPEVDLAGYDAVVLGFPKWTFSCPPLNRFIVRLRRVSGPKFFLLMTCGGFDDRRFLRSIKRKLVQTGCNVVESLTVKRNDVRRKEYGMAVDLFAKVVEEHLQR